MGRKPSNQASQQPEWKCPNARVKKLLLCFVAAVLDNPIKHLMETEEMSIPCAARFELVELQDREVYYEIYLLLMKSKGLGKACQP